MPNWFNTDITKGLRNLDDRTVGLDTLKRKIKTLQNKVQINVLDVGCAEGLIADWLLDKSGQVFGVEGDPDKVRAAQQLFPDKNHTFIHGDASQLKKVLENSGAKPTYEVVLLLAILQKLPNPLEVLHDALSKASMFVAIRVPDYWYKEYWTTELYSSLRNEWTITTYVPAEEPDDNFQGHLIVLERNSVSAVLNDIRQQLKEESKATAVESADAVIISFPKSGRTWLRYYIATWLNLEHSNGFDLEFTPQRYWTPERHALDFPYIHFTHDFFDIHQDDKADPIVLYQKLYTGKKLVLLIRNPFDTMVSYYYHKHKREAQTNLPIEEFMLSPRYGIGRYCEWMSQMLDYLHSREMLTLTYENMIEDMPREMSRLFKYLGIADPHNNIPKAAELSRFDQMQKAEVEASMSGSSQGVGRLAMSGWDGDFQKLKVRKGQVGGWQDEISPELLAKMLEDPRVSSYLTILKARFPASSHP